MNIEKLSSCGKICTYNENDIICLEGNPGDTAYLLLKGGAKVLVGSFRDTAKEVARIPVGTIFGEMSLLEGNPRSATVAAAGDGTTVLEIGKNDFLELIRTEPELAFNLMKTMYNRIEAGLNKHIGYLVAFAAETRRNQMYEQIGKLSEEQFEMIVKQDDKHALRLLTFLGRTLTEFDKKVIAIGV